MRSTDYWPVRTDGNGGMFRVNHMGGIAMWGHGNYMAVFDVDRFMRAT